MPPFASSTIFYAVLVAPGFVTVFTTISLAAVERDHSEFSLLVWSLVMSLIIDTLFLTWYQASHNSVSTVNQLPRILFNPRFHPAYVFGILATGFALGILGTIILLLELPDRTRRLLQHYSKMAVNPRQPWANFLRDTDSAWITTSDGEEYEGLVIEWSRAGRPKQLRVQDPYRYVPETNKWVPTGGEEMLFLQKDIDRVIMREPDFRLTLSERVHEWISECGGSNSEFEEYEEDKEADDQSRGDEHSSEDDADSEGDTPDSEANQQQMRNQSISRGRSR